MAMALATTPMTMTMATEFRIRKTPSHWIREFHVIRTGMVWVMP